MNTSALKALFDPAGAFEHPVFRTVAFVAVGAVAAGLIAPIVLGKRIKPELARDIRVRTLTWIALIVITLGAIALGQGTTIALVGLLSLLCYREFARATGLFRETLVSLIVALGIIAVTFANFDHWRGLVGGLIAIVPMLICVCSILRDAPKGYIQRCALGSAAFMLFGVGLGRLGGIACDHDFRPILALTIFLCQISDVSAYCFGKALGRRKLLPNTSPGKTLAGHLGALVTVSALGLLLWPMVFTTGDMHAWPHALALGFIVALCAQLGDLLISSVKRDVGIKDMGAVLPGHGGVLDRCNSLLLAAPAVYHYLLFFRGLGLDAPVRIITGP
jgi:phosphatidate cytidylyltransferase